ncbi:15576_t:CDS:10 [Acaulospora colombiana]|uniref:15576_t:CDS:1 n=1 Tax=Acaulospora colombiana TaxID=27376 RepID=A0ACA9L799_9GLOM|nr:15576_t:CDS:10 [Acaulospora colombiana]
MATWSYPPVRRDESFIEELHGVKVADPYRWLEDPEAEETKEFVTAQNALTAKYLETYPHREKFRETLTEMYDYERYGCPFKRGNHYYYFYNTGLQAQDVLYQLKDSLDSKRVEFFNPNIIEKDGTASLRTYSFSKHGNYFAYGISKSGSDWVTVHLKTTNLEEQVQLDDAVEWIKFSTISWTHDEAGFFYQKYPRPEKDVDKGTETDTTKNAMIYYHKLGTPQTEDILIYKDPENPEYMFNVRISEDGRYVIVDITKDCDPMNKLWIFDLEKSNYEITGLKVQVNNSMISFCSITNDNTRFYFKTNLNAPRYRVVKYDLAHPEEGFTEIVGEHPKDVLSSADVVAETNLVLTYMHDVKEEICIHDLTTGKHILDLPLPIGSVESLKGRKEDTEFFFKFISFLNPGIIYRYDFINKSLKEYRVTAVKGLKSDLLETKQVFVNGKDDTKIPVFIIALKSIILDGNNPTLLYGYGGFNISITPTFSPSWINFIQHYNGVVAVANIRGGGEYGEEWHKAGMLANKQNVFDDFQEVSKWLVENKITRPEKLTINGGSNGGLLVGACVNQAPELFGCAVASVGVMDMLRFHKFTIGHAWRSDYGDPDKKENFEYIYKVPLHSYKYIATLQHVAKENPNPLTIRIDTKAGHGSGKPTKKIIDESTDKYSFIALSTGAEWVD